MIRSVFLPFTVAFASSIATAGTVTVLNEDFESTEVSRRLRRSLRTARTTTSASMAVPPTRSRDLRTQELQRLHGRLPHRPGPRWRGCLPPRHRRVGQPGHRGSHRPVFSGAFAEFFDSPGDIDNAGDLIDIQVSIDGSAFQSILTFEGTDFSSSVFNGVFEATDTGVQLGNNAQTFARTIAGSGSLLSLRASFNLNSGDEDFAVDDFMITGDMSVIPLPGPAAMAFASLAGLSLVTAPSLALSFKPILFSHEPLTHTHAGGFFVSARPLRPNAFVGSPDTKPPRSRRAWRTEPRTRTANPRPGSRPGSRPAGP